MDEKDRVITKIYNESKERARWEVLESFASGKCVAWGVTSEGLKTKDVALEIVMWDFVVM